MTKKMEDAKAPYRLAIVDDHFLIREGLKAVISREPDLVICCESEGGQMLPQLIQSRRPSALILDLSLPDIDGLELLQNVHRLYPKLPILVLSGQNERIYAERALRAGAKGFLPKSELSEHLIRALRMVLAGGLFATDQTTTRLLAREADPKSSVRHQLDGLSNREFELFQLLGQGLSSRAVALRWNRSLKTVETYRESLKHKLRLTSASELVHEAILCYQAQQLPHLKKADETRRTAC